MTPYADPIRQREYRREWDRRHGRTLGRARDGSWIPMRPGHGLRTYSEPAPSPSVMAHGSEDDEGSWDTPRDEPFGEAPSRGSSYHPKNPLKFVTDLLGL